MKKNITGKLLTAAACMLLSMIVFIGTPTLSMAYTQTTGIVSVDAAKMRKEPSTSSDAVVGLLKGSTVTITDEVTDSAGMVWYKVSAGNDAGYIRSDLLIKATTSTGNTNSSGNNNSSGNGNSNNQTDNKPAPTTATPIAETKAYVNYESARIREGASTEHETLGSATKNTAVTITGEAKASDGKKWYQIKYTTSEGREVVGFIRADLLTIGEPPAAVVPETPAEETGNENAEGGAAESEDSGEEAAAEETEETPVEPEEPILPEEETKPDYEMVYTQNNEGENEWYLYDNINGTRQTLAGLMSAAEAGAAQDKNDSDQLATQKIIIIILAVVTAILAVAVTLLLFKIRDLYSDDYEDEEEDEEEDDEEDEDDEEEEEEIPVRRRRENKSVKPARELKEKTVQGTFGKAQVSKPGRADEELSQETPKTQPRKKTKNFLIDDDEFEFEFLNMDDKE